MSILRLNLVLTYGIPPEFCCGVHLVIYNIIRHRVSPEYIGSRNCVPMALNVKSLSGMGLTRERWCCARGWLRRLDMNTCQTSIKTDIYIVMPW